MALNTLFHQYFYYFCRGLNLINLKHMKLNRIKIVLVEKEISQVQLAEKIGKSFSTINAYCCNRVQPSLDTLQRISEILGVKMKDLIIEQEER